MDRNLSGIENLFKSELNDSEEKAPVKVWQNVEHILDKDNANKFKRKYSDVKRVATILLLLLAGLGIYDLREKFGDVAVTNKGQTTKKDVPESRIYRKSARLLPLKADSFIIDEKGRSLAKEKSVPDPIEPNSPEEFEKIDEKNRGEASLDDLKGREISVQNLKNDLPGASNNRSGRDRKNDFINFKDYANNDIRSSTFSKRKIVDNRPAVLEKNPDKKYVSTAGRCLVARQINFFLPEMNVRPDVLGHFDMLSRTMQELPTLKTLPATADRQYTNKQAVRLRNARENNQPKISASMFFSPDIAWYRLQDDFANNQADDADELEKEEQHEFSFSFGALVDYRLNKQLTFQTGLTFSNTEITVEPKTIYAQPDNSGSIKYRFNTSSGYSYVLPSFSNSPAIGDSLYTLVANHRLQYISIPIALKYNVTKGKYNFNLMGGISTSFLTKGKIETELRTGTFNEHEIINNIQGLKSAYVSGLLGVGTDYSLSKKIAVTFAPTARFALSAINKGAIVKSYPHSFGMAAGIRVKL